MRSNNTQLAASPTSADDKPPTAATVGNVRVSTRIEESRCSSFAQTGTNGWTPALPKATPTETKPKATVNNAAA